MTGKRGGWQLLLITMLAAGVFNQQAEARTWADISGKFTVDAHLLGVIEGKARLQRTDGPVVEIPLTKLCAEDQEFIKEWLAKQEELRPLYARLKSNDAKELEETLKELLEHEEAAAPALPRVMELLKHKEYPVRFYAARTLREIGEQAAPAMDLLLKLYGDDDAAGGEARQALNAIGDAAWPKWVAALRSDNENIRLLAANVVGKSGERGLPILQPLLKDPDPKLRVVAISGIARTRLSTEFLLPIYVAGLKDPDDQVKQHACWGLLGLKEEARPALEQLLALSNNANLDLRRTALQTIMIAAPDDARLLPAAIAYLKTKDNMFVSTDLMKTIGEPAIAPLAELLADKDPEIRNTAALCLGKVEGSRKAAVPALVKMLEGEDLNAKAMALEALKGMGAESQPAKRQVVQLLENESLRSNAIEVLAAAELPPAEVLPHFIKAVGDESFLVANPAVKALEEMGPAAASAVPALQAALGTTDSDSLRTNIRRALSKIKPQFERRIQAYSSQTESLVMAADGKSFFTGGSDDEEQTEIHQWDLKGELLHSIPVKAFSVGAMALSPGGRQIAVAADARLKILTLPGGAEALAIDDYLATGLCLGWSQDGGQLASVGDDTRTVHIQMQKAASC